MKTTAKPADGCDHTDVIQHVRPEARAYSPGLLDTTLNQGQKGFEGLSDHFFIPVAGRKRLERFFHFQFDNHQRLTDAVMQIPRNPFAFFLLGTLQASGKIAQLLFRRLQRQLRFFLFV